MRRFALRTFAMAQKETYHILRDSRTLVLAFVMPILLIVVFGYGVSFDLDHSPLVIVDFDNTPHSRQLAEAFEAGREFVVTRHTQSLGDVMTAFRRNQASAALVIPYRYGADVSRGASVPLQFLVDGANGTTAASVLGSATGVFQAESQRLSGGKSAPPLVASVTMQYNPGLHSGIFFVPGLIAYVLAIVAVLLTALTVAREWERGNMEQLFATPVGRLEIVIGKLLPYLALGFVQALLVLVVGTTLFSVPILGSLLLLWVAVALFLIAMLGQGVLISVVTRSQQIATLASAVTTLLPTLLLSGFMYPVSNMPTVLQWLSLIFPARYFITILRGVMLKGNGFWDLEAEFLGLGVFSLLVILLATLRFQRRVA